MPPEDKKTPKLGPNQLRLLESDQVVTYRAPTNKDRRILLESFSSEDLAKKDGRYEEALAYSCITAVDDRDVSKLSWVMKSDDFEVKDGQYFFAHFMEKYNINREEASQAQALARKSLRSATETN